MKFYGGKNMISVKKNTAVLLALILLLGLGVGGTVAYLATSTTEIVNTFTPADVKIDTEEEFDGKVKKNVYVKNPGDVDVYVRVKLVTYMTDNNGKPTSAIATIPPFTPEQGWKYCPVDGCYYYLTSVKPGNATNDLIPESGIELQANQVVEVLVEGIQAEPDAAVVDAWKSGVSAASSGKLTVKD